MNQFLVFGFGVCSLLNAKPRTNNQTTNPRTQTNDERKPRTKNKKPKTDSST